MSSSPFDVGVLVLGAPTSPRVLVRHGDLLRAYADGVMAEKGETREAYLSLYTFGPEMQAHVAANKGSVAGYAGACWCRWLVLDIDRPDLADALAGTRRLVTVIYHRYPELVGDVPVYFSGSKGFHVLIELAHNPPPAVGFNRVARALAESIAASAGVQIDAGIYDLARVIRAPNTQHPKTGLFKRRIESESLFLMTPARILEHAKHPAGDGLPVARSVPANLSRDWRAAELAVARADVARTEQRAAAAVTPDSRAPRYLIDLLRFGVGEGMRHQTLFRAAAWLTEQGAPPSLVRALLTEPGLDVGLPPRDVERQIACGVAHAQRQRTAAGPRPDPVADPDIFEQQAVRGESDSLPPGAAGFPFGGPQDEGGLS
jgi:hypothetical protein